MKGAMFVARVLLSKQISDLGNDDLLTLAHKHTIRSAAVMFKQNTNAKDLSTW